MSEELQWVAPGEGDWWSVREHFPYPVSQLFASLFPPVTIGWKTSGARYGLATGAAQWAPVNGYIYYGPHIALTAEEVADRQVVAAATLAAVRAGADAPWQEEVRRWHDEERPAVVAADLALQEVDVAVLDDVALSAHLHRAIENFRRWAPLHFEHTGFDLAAGVLLELTDTAGIAAHEVLVLLTGSSPASAAVDQHLGRVADALELAGAPPCASLDEVRAADAVAARALETFLLEHRWRPVAGHDLLEPTLGERPDLLVASIAARRRGRRGAADVTAPTAAVRGALPASERDRFDRLLADARAAYALRDDDVGVCFNWPVGLIRRAGREAGRRLADQGVIDEPDDVFEAVIDELASLFAGRGPDGSELARRRQIRLRAASVVPPLHLAGGGSSLEEPTIGGAVAELTAIRDPLWAVAPPRADEPLHGIGIGSDPVRGPARIVRSAEEIADVEEGDVLVAVATTTAFNAVFPIVGAVVTEQGGLLSHTAILAREVGVPAVIGVVDVFDHVQAGDLVEVDPTTGSVRVLDRPT